MKKLHPKTLTSPPLLDREEHVRNRWGAPPPAREDREGVRFANKMITAFFVGLLTLPALAQEKPTQFTTRLPIHTEAAAPYYRLSLPLAAYLASAHGDLRDLRVFNAAGQPVPYARLAASGSTEEQVQKQALRWFPLQARDAGQTTQAADDTSLNLTLRQGPDGTLVQIKAGSSTSASLPAQQAAPLLRGYVLDASQITDRQAARGLLLDWDKNGGDFQLLDVESSDDLQHWQRLASGVQLARLDYNGARIENRRIELAGFHDRYLRLLWREPATAPQLSSAELEQSRSRYLAAPLVWSAPLVVSKEKADLKPGEYRFRLPQPLPLAKLRLSLPPGNQLLPLEILTPGRERRYWNHLASTVVYRISNQGREWSNSDIPLPGTPLQEFVLRLDPRLSPLAGGPQLAFAVQPAQIVFLASGSGPYALAIGNKDAQDAALPTATLVPGFGQPGSPEIVAASIVENAVEPESSGIPAPAASERDWKKIALWSVLLLGVLGMLGMAWSLITQMNKSKV
ncbi:MAG: hypothetical protein H6R19_2377 [Proteobacteria bacterium]|nr:hypothetical protein [Pseudomonadota bacterium]